MRSTNNTKVYEMGIDNETIMNYLIEQSHTKQYKKRGRDEKYYNIPASFDIETSSIRVYDGVNIDKHTDYGRKCAFMYIWQFAIRDFVIIGRTWQEFKEFVGMLKDAFKLDSSNYLVVYVHNLGFEFQFIRNHFEWDDVFAKEQRNPIYARTTEGLEFRDSLILSGLSLEKTAENLFRHKIRKLVGDLDYTQTRTPKTPITDEELGYCINDVLIITAYIDECIEEFKNITNIPLTNTGRVRKLFKQNCLYNKNGSGTYQNRAYMRKIERCTLTAKQYEACRRAFMGGFTHANYQKSFLTHENVSSYDFTSSYPAVMCSEMFPMAAPKERKIEKMSDLEFYCWNYCCIFDIYYKNIRMKSNQYESPISVSKCQFEDGAKRKTNNGRLMSCDGWCKITITNIDYKVFKAFYDYDEIKIGEFYYFYKDYLPKEFIETLLDLYEIKTSLKGVEEKREEYQKGKGMLNSSYGMAVMAIDHNNVLYDNETGWNEEGGNLEADLKEYNEKKGRFLYYPWGVFITAYARRNLFTAIYELKDDFIYADTDSVKFTNREAHLEYFRKYDENILKKLSAMCSKYNIDIERIRPKTIKGVAKMLGEWDYEGTYKRFKTLGAKRYIVEDENGEIEITASGIRKPGKEWIAGNEDPFSIFDDNLTLDAGHSGVLMHTYIDQECTTAILKTTARDYLGNECEVEELSSTHLEKSDFSISVADEYLRLCSQYGLFNLLKM